MKDLLAALFRRRRLFAKFFTLMVLVPMTFAYVLPKKYEGQATLLVESGRFKKPFLPSERDARTTMLQVSMEDVGSEVELLLSRPVLEVVVDKNHLDLDVPPPIQEIAKWAGYWLLRGLDRTLVTVGLRPDVPARDAAIDRLSRKVDIEFVKRTNIINVSWRGSTPELARDVVNTLVDAYVQHHIRVHGNSFALDAMKNEMELTRAKLMQLESGLGDYGIERAIGDIDKQHADCVTKLTDAQNRYMLLKGVGEKGLTSSELSRLDNEPAFAGLWAKLNELELRKIELQSRYGARERRLNTLDQEMDRLKAIIRERFERNLSSAREQVAMYRRKLADLEQAKLEIERRRRDLDGVKAVYNLNREKYNEIQISTAMDLATVASVRVVQYATANPAPVFPKRLVIFVVSTFLGLVGGLAVAVSFDRASNRVLSVGDAEAAAGGPVLASIREHARKRARARTSDEEIARDLIPVRDALLGDSASKRIVLLASPSDGAGTSTLATQLALISAGSGRRILVVEFRYRDGRARATAEAALGVDLDHATLADARTTEGHSRLLVWIPQSGAPSEPGQVARIMAEIDASALDVVILDAPSRRGDSFYLQLVPHADAVVLVAGYDRTSRHALARMAELVRREGAAIAGCILNRRREPIPESIYRSWF